MPLIGFLCSRSAADSSRVLDGFHGGLAEAGLTEGQNVAVIYRWAKEAMIGLPHGCLTSRRVEKMSNEWVGFVKMRGSIWCVLAGLAVGIAGVIWSGNHQDPIFRLYHDCESREWDQRKIYSRPPEPITKR